MLTKKKKKREKIVVPVTSLVLPPRTRARYLTTMIEIYVVINTMRGLLSDLKNKIKSEKIWKATVDVS